jgi:hypothetical protein
MIGIGPNQDGNLPQTAGMRTSAAPLLMWIDT